MALMSKILQKNNYSIDLLSCRGLLSGYCTLQMETSQLNTNEELNKNRCQWCTAYNREISEKYYRNTGYLDDFFSTSEAEPAIEELIRKCTPDKIPELQYAELPIGRIAAFDCLRINKILNLEQMGETELIFYKKCLTNVLRIFFAFRNFLKNAPEKYQHIMIFDNPSGLNQIVARIAGQQGIPCSGAGHWWHPEKLFENWYITAKNEFQYLLENVSYFNNNHRRLFISRTGYELTFSYIKKLWADKTGSFFPMERNKNLSEVKSRCGITGKHDRTVLLATSSQDEIFAWDFAVHNGKMLQNCRTAFPSQEVWIQNCIDYFSQNPRYKLIIRIHPREYKHFKSKSAEKLTAMLKNLPENIHLNTPEENISIYDLYDLSDICLIRNSSVGQEAALLGIPTFSYIESMCFFPVHTFSENPEEYFRKLDKVLKKKPERSLKQIFFMLKWLQFIFSSVAFHFNSNNYWKRFPEKTESALKKKLDNIKNNKPVLSINKFMKEIENFPLFEQAFSEYFSSELSLTEIIQKKAKNEPGDEWQQNFDKQKAFSDLIKALFNMEEKKDKNRQKLETAANCGNKTAAFILRELYDQNLHS
jgi:hypothetical protein